MQKKRSENKEHAKLIRFSLILESKRHKENFNFFETMRTVNGSHCDVYIASQYENVIRAIREQADLSSLDTKQLIITAMDSEHNSHLLR